MFYYCGIVSMRYLLTDYLGEHSNNHIISAILRCLVLLRLIEGDYICGGSTSSHSEQRSKTRKSRWYCNAMRGVESRPFLYERKE